MLDGAPVNQDQASIACFIRIHCLFEMRKSAIALNSEFLRDMCAKFADRTEMGFRYFDNKSRLFIQKFCKLVESNPLSFTQENDFLKHYIHAVTFTNFNCTMIALRSLQKLLQKDDNEFSLAVVEFIKNNIREFFQVLDDKDQTKQAACMTLFLTVQE